MKKYKKYFLVVNDGSAKYVKLESELPFSISEGKNHFKEAYPNATKVSYISEKKAKIFLALEAKKQK